MNDQTKKSAPKKRSEKCPLCAKSASESFAPFCSAGCKDRDLLNWLGDGYRMAGPPAIGDQEAGD